MARVMTPMLWLRPPAKLRAIGLGTKSNSAMARSTACFFASLTTAVPFKIRETVLNETPASWATISMVTGPVALAFFKEDRVLLMTSVYYH